MARVARHGISGWSDLELECAASFYRHHRATRGRAVRDRPPGSAESVLAPVARARDKDRWGGRDCRRRCARARIRPLPPAFKFCVDQLFFIVRRRRRAEEARKMSLALRRQGRRTPIREKRRRQLIDRVSRESSREPCSRLPERRAVWLPVRISALTGFSDSGSSVTLVDARPASAGWWDRTADGFHLVAEKLHTRRAVGFRRIDIEDAAAQSVLAGHLDHVGFRVADVFKCAEAILSTSNVSPRRKTCARSE